MFLFCLIVLVSCIWFSYYNFIKSTQLQFELECTIKNNFWNGLSGFTNELPIWLTNTIHTVYTYIQIDHFDFILLLLWCVGLLFIISASQKFQKEKFQMHPFKAND